MERVFADLHDWLRWGEPEQIVLRQFEPEISLEYEFRAFIFNGKLNAITQYDHYCIYPNLLNIQEKIKQKIFLLWQSVHSYVGEQSYIMDFAYLPQKDLCIVIELSPFLTCTGTACFSWRMDRAILEGGPFEFRLVKHTHPDLHMLVIIILFYCFVFFVMHLNFRCKVIGKIDG